MNQIRITRKVPTLALAALLLVGMTACGNDEPDDQPASAPSSAPSSPSSTAPTDPETSPPEEEEESVTYETWFASGGGNLFVASRTQVATPAVGRAAMESLLAGPTDIERDAAVTTAIPSGTELLGLSIDGGIATVDLSGEFDDGGGSKTMFMRLAQVVFTLTQFESVDAVDFMIDGQAVSTFSSEGIVLEDPQRRRDYKDQLPSVLVTSPSIGSNVASPVMVEGTANVFEANVSIRILDAQGDVVTETFTTATCGTGCRGSYSESVEFEVAAEQQGTIEVYWGSPEDGSPQDVVSIPVTLSP